MSVIENSLTTRFKWLFCVLWFCWIAVAGADEVILQSQDIIHGTITEQTEEYLVIEHPDLGVFKISRQRIKSFTRETPSPPEPSKEVTDAVKNQAPPTSEETTEPTPKPTDDIPETLWYDPEFNRLNRWAAGLKEKGFKMSLNLSLDNSYGNTDEQSLRVGTTVGRSEEDKRLTADATYYNKTKEGDTSDNKLTAGFRRDFLWPGSRWFYFYDTRYDFDEFESWRHRVSGHTGPGYHLVDTERFTLDGLLGPGLKKEWGSDNDDLYAEGMAGLDLEYKITKRQTLTAHTAYYPVLNDFGDYRTRSGLDWRYLMDMELKLSLVASLEHEYVQIVDPGDKRNDTRVFMGIRYDF